MKLERVEIAGRRHYITPIGNLPSVTTVLKETQSERDRSGLAFWRRKVGKVRVERVSWTAGVLSGSVREGCEVMDIKKLLAEYASLAWELGATDRAHIFGMTLEITHMLDVIPSEPEAREAHLNKLNRWLGWLQGWMYCTAGRSIETLRDETRGIDAALRAL